MQGGGKGRKPEEDFDGGEERQREKGGTDICREEWEVEKKVGGIWKGKGING